MIVLLSASALAGVEVLVEDPAFDELFLGTIRVTRGEEVLLDVSRGVDRSGQPADADTVYWVGSISKPFAAAALLSLLAEQGGSIDDPVAPYVEGWPADALRSGGVDCTVAMLLSHQCGLPHDIGSPRDDVHADPAAEARFLAELRGAPLEFTPGTEHAYSNAGFTLAGVLVARLGRAPYAEVVQQRLIAPLGLHSTGCDPSGLADRAAPGHFDVPWGRLSSERWLRIPWDAPSRVGAAGNMFATATELTAWFRALMSGRVLRSDDAASMTTPRRDDYGLGLVIRDRPYGRLAWHNGALSPHGHNAFVGHVAATDTTVVVLANRGSEVVSATKIGFALVDLAHDRPAAPPLAIGPGKRLTGGLVGAVLVGMTLVPLLWCLVALRLPSKDGLIAWSLQVVTATSMVLIAQAVIDTFRDPPPVLLPLLALEGVVLALGLRWRPDQPLLAPGRERPVGLAALATALGLLGVSAVVGAALSTLAVIAVAAGALLVSRRR